MQNTELLPEGDAYAQLPKCAVIFLLEDAYFKYFEDGHNEFQMCRTWPVEKTRVLHNNDPPSLHFIELGKLRSSGGSEDPILTPWLGLMLPSSAEEWDNIPGADPCSRS